MWYVLLKQIEGIFTCYSGHFIGFKVKGQENNLCLFKEFPLKVKLQDLIIQDFSSQHLDIDEVMRHNKISEMNKMTHLDTFKCLICDPLGGFHSHKDLSYHLQEQKEHKYKLEIFRENL